MKRDWRGIYDSLVVARSAIVGKGLFSGTRIAKRAKIGEFEGEVIGLREARRRAKGRAISWGSAFDGMTNVNVYNTQSGCSTLFSDGYEMALPGDRVVAFWVDATGRRSRVSSPVLVEKTR